MGARGWTRLLGLVVGALVAVGAVGQVRRVPVEALTRRTVSQTAGIASFRGAPTPTSKIVTSGQPMWSGPVHAGDTVRYDIVIANQGPAQAGQLRFSQALDNLALQSRTWDCSPLNCAPFPAEKTPGVYLRLLPSNTTLTVHTSATVVASGDFKAVATVAVETPHDPASTLSATVPGSTDLEAPPRPPPPPPPPPPPAPPQLIIAPHLTPVGPYHSGQEVLLAVDISNAGASPAVGVGIANAPQNLRTEMLWGGCAASPCPAFDVEPLGQKQIIIPASIIDSSQAIDDTLTVSADGLPTQQANVHVDAGQAVDPRPPPPPPPVVTPTPHKRGFGWRWRWPPPPWQIALAAGAALAAGLGARQVVRSRQRGRWMNLITTRAALDPRGEASTPFLPLTAPPIGVRARLAPGQVRTNGPIPLRRIS